MDLSMEHWSSAMHTLAPLLANGLKNLEAKAAKMTAIYLSPHFEGQVPSEATKSKAFAYVLSSIASRLQYPSVSPSRVALHMPQWNPAPPAELGTIPIFLVDVFLRPQDGYNADSLDEPLMVLEANAAFDEHVLSAGSTHVWCTSHAGHMAMERAVGKTIPVSATIQHHTSQKHGTPFTSTHFHRVDELNYEAQGKLFSSCRGMHSAGSRLLFFWGAR